MALDLRRLDERNRLERGLVDGKQVSGVAPAGMQEFDAVIAGMRRPASRDRANAQPVRGATSKRLTARGIATEDVEDLVEYIIGELLPGLDLAPEMAAIATEILAEEVEAARAVSRRIAEAQAIDVRA
ncbi:hypothetical protein IB262_33170 [Ensifer sp. ENS02]|uniref:hypothetical protein n=1 Tax=Ensifer sp. ENS02 TaxID=2769290 RepID=UPI001781926A|nr:hypothetical protein [Ensifer sp. ENS02]MBD9524729.1 hypothetical protein [Ensifer sp. ENS02]